MSVFLKPIVRIYPWWLSWGIILFLTAVILPVHAEYYQYRDENGVLTFTDDPGAIPDHRSDNVIVHKERFDGMEEAEKSKIIERETNEIKSIRQQKAKDIERYDYLNRIHEIKQAEIERKKRLERIKTPVTISNNQIIVPVTICYSDRKVTTPLILDTGASITVIDTSVAEQLNITSGKRSAARVAGGGIVKSRLVDLQSIQVGPKTLQPHKVMVITQKGPNVPYKGLLGLDFLRNFDYSIDYENHYIRWKE